MNERRVLGNAEDGPNGYSRARRIVRSAPSEWLFLSQAAIHRLMRECLDLVATAAAPLTYVAAEAADIADVQPAEWRL